MAETFRLRIYNKLPRWVGCLNFLAMFWDFGVPGYLGQVFRYSFSELAAYVYIFCCLLRGQNLRVIVFFRDERHRWGQNQQNRGSRACAKARINCTSMQPSNWLITPTTKNSSAWNGLYQNHSTRVRWHMCFLFPFALPGATVQCCVGNRVAFCTALSRLATVSRGENHFGQKWFDSSGERVQSHI